MNSSTVYIVDDDEAIRDALSWLFQSRGVKTADWPSAETFLAACTPDMSGCLLLDVRMEGMSGLQLFDRLQELNCPLPVIFLTGHGDVPLAVAALKKGALDFLEKPFNDNELVDRVIQALEQDALRRARQAEGASQAARVASLSERERQVMELILAGKLNKLIADELSIAMRTVEVHRARIFEKMGVKSAVELAQMLSGKA
ncbi:MAG: response regulator [Rhodocyclaceae bacterium]|nr:response regulator [Rhodocyclaceae bacterium]